MVSSYRAPTRSKIFLDNPTGSEVERAQFAQYCIRVFRGLSVREVDRSGPQDGHKGATSEKG